MTHAATYIIGSLLAALGNAAVRSLVLGALVAAALGAFRVKNVRMKLLAWRGLLAAALAMPLLILFTPAIPVAVRLPNLPQREVIAAATAMKQAITPVVTPSPAIEAAAASPETVRSAPVGIASKHAEPVPANAPTAQPAAPSPLAPHRAISWAVLALGAYIAIALGLLARILVGVRFGKRLLRSAKSVSDGGALRLLATTSRAAGLRSDPQLLESDALCVPLMLGLRSPAILLPSDWRTWDHGELAAVLAHEISHVERNDALAQRLALIHRAIFWFSPLAWWLERHLDELAEQASDEAALAAGADRTRYAETLLGFFAELEAGPERVWWQGVSMAKAGQAEKRVDRILAWRGAMSNRLKKSLVAGFVVIAAPIVAFTAAARPAAQDVEPPPAPVAPLLVFVQAAPVAAPTPAPDPAQAPAPPSAPAPDSAAAPAPPPPPPSAEQAPAQDEIWINVPALNLPQVTVPPVHVKVPRIRLESRLFAGQEDGNWPVFFSSNGDWNLGNWGGYYVGRYDDWSPRFAIVTHDSDSLTMSGDREDAEHARALKQKYSGDFIWFERDGKHYVINDGATVSRAKQLWQPNEDLSKQQQDLGKQMHGLQKQMEDSRQKIEDAKIKLPDMSAEMQKLEETMKQLNASGGTMRDIGDLQRQMGELQRQIGEVEAAAGRDVGAWGRDQGDLGRKMGDIGRQEGELGRKQGQAARDAARQMQQLLDDAVSKGLAKPE